MSLKGKIVLVKFVGEEDWELIQIHESDATGIWFQNEGFLTRKLGDERPSAIGDFPAIFVPLAQIEWLTVSDKDARI
jgi:hypothetical protein